MGLLSIRWNWIGAADRPHSRAHGTIVKTSGDSADIAVLLRSAGGNGGSLRLTGRAGDRSLQRRRGLRSAVFAGGKIRRIIEVEC